MENKRKTLGPINSNQLNSRASIAPARVTKDGLASKKLSLLVGRPSLAGAKGLPGAGIQPKSSLANAAGPRRSSALGKPNNTGLKADPRPMNDKSFQQSCIRYLISYLSTHGYDQPVSPKTLTSPMSKDFTFIVHFLMRQIDPNMSQKSFGKLEDDVPAFYKRLKYPFQISKSSLFAVGSPHTWPSLLASLVWVTELLSYAEKAEHHSDSGLEDEKQKAESDFFEYVSESYRCFLAGDDDKCEAVDNAKAAEFEKRASEIQLQNQALIEENRALEAKIAALKASPTPLEASKAKHEEHSSDREKFKKLISNLQSHKESLGVKVQEREADLQSKQSQLELEQQECQELQQRVSEQAYNREDVSRMEDERERREKGLQAAEAASESTDRRVADQESAMQQSMDDLDSTLQDYNESARRLQLIPTTAKRACGQQFEGRADRDGNSASEIVNVDFKGMVRSTLNKLKDTAASRSHELVEEMLSLQETLDTLLHSLTERTEENATLTVEVRSRDRQHNEDKEAHETELALINAQADQVKHEISELKNTTIHSVSNSSQRLQQLEAQYEDALRTCDMERSLFNQDLDAAMHAISSHKDSVTILLQKTHQTVSDIVCEDMVLCQA